MKSLLLLEVSFEELSSLLKISLRGPIELLLDDLAVYLPRSRERDDKTSHHKVTFQTTLSAVRYTALTCITITLFRFANNAELPATLRLIVIHNSPAI
jgi:hypothetical protein